MSFVKKNNQNKRLKKHDHLVRESGLRLRPSTQQLFPPNLHRTPTQDQDPDQGGAQSHTGSEPRPESASAESRSAVRSERSLVAPCGPDVALRGEPSGETAQEEEVEEEEEEVEEQQGSGSGEDVQRRSPDHSSLEGKFRFQ